MKHLLILLSGICIMASCNSKTPLEEIVEKRCNCLRLYSEEKNNIVDVADCMDKVNKDEKYNELGEEEIMELLKKTCPDAILPE